MALGVEVEQEHPLAVEAGEGARRASVINQKAEGWAFQITDYDFQDFTPRVLSIVERGFTPE